MSKKLTEKELKAIARQLGHPQGEQGIRTAEKMAQNNAGMTLASMAALDLQSGEQVLEIGPGNASHLQDLLQKASGLHYIGVDISQTMVQEAARINAAAVEEKKALFLFSDGAHIPMADHYADKIFTVNTLYFWSEPLVYAKEIHRVLRPGGKFCLTFADRDFMESLPFTSFGFNLYHLDQVLALLTQAGFKVLKTDRHSETLSSNATGEQVERIFFNVVAEA
ncbi:class I SAM-dependent methyltransferase [Pedobacter nutrimenti]|jgi:SAM-dependent methyltransferase|uniref:Methyltransferase family protein n=1 Tax=Pedobacter nutrimenti TaxID=1241337 RepID=A0A318UN99_9SPHI|nr:class I SAM-dependent methyltransferase [Pedobacter nutrimenti]PYF77231.1 methyltransferase family protein [Pedobacter nutrimenti]